MAWGMWTFTLPQLWTFKSSCSFWHGDFCLPVLSDGGTDCCFAWGHTFYGVFMSLMNPASFDASNPEQLGCFSLALALSTDYPSTCLSLVVSTSQLPSLLTLLLWLPAVTCVLLQPHLTPFPSHACWSDSWTQVSQFCAVSWGWASFAVGSCLCLGLSWCSIPAIAYSWDCRCCRGTKSWHCGPRVGLLQTPQRMGHGPGELS